MTRFGVMKHLKQLEEAGLVVTRRRGREKLHFLNPVPIRLVHDRWVSKYAEPWVAGLSDLKQRLESSMEKVFEIYIRTTPDRLWEAITDPEIRAKYNFGAERRLRLEAGLASRDGAYPKPASCSARARCSRSTRRAGSSTRWSRSVSEEAKAEGTVAGHVGDRTGRRLLPADRSPTTRCAKAPATSSTAVGR